MVRNPGVEPTLGTEATLLCIELQMDVAHGSYPTDISLRPAYHSIRAILRVYHKSVNLCQKESGSVGGETFERYHPMRNRCTINNSSLRTTESRAENLPATLVWTTACAAPRHHTPHRPLFS
jgi:hypothetical protein